MPVICASIFPLYGILCLLSVTTGAAAGGGPAQAPLPRATPPRHPGPGVGRVPAAERATRADRAGAGASPSPSPGRRTPPHPSARRSWPNVIDVTSLSFLVKRRNIDHIDLGRLGLVGQPRGAGTGGGRGLAEGMRWGLGTHRRCAIGLFYRHRWHIDAP